MILITNKDNMMIFPDAIGNKSDYAFNMELKEKLEGGFYCHKFNNCFITETNDNPDNNEIIVKIKYDTDKRLIDPDIFNSFK